jgi:AraC family transcriptional regulator
MSDTHCPYCNSAKSILIGNVFCSKHANPMESLNSGTLFIKTAKLEETDWHISRLSIRCMLNGTQHYQAGSRQFSVNPNNFLVVNQGQEYKTAFESAKELEMIMVGFKPGFAEDVFQTLTRPESWLLDNPDQPAAPMSFFEKTFEKDEIISNIFIKLKLLIDSDDISYKKHFDIDVLYSELMERLISLHYRIYGQLEVKSQRKKSTKVEIYKRLSIAKDLIDASYMLQLSLEELASGCYLSLHYFKRLFKEYFGISPHQYIISKRLEVSKELLLNESHTVKEICQKVGFESDASFIRLFRERMGVTPSSYRSK